MSIRKPSHTTYHLPREWTASVPTGWSNASNWATRAWASADADYDCTGSRFSVTKQFSVPLPDWTKKYEGFKESAFSFGGNPKLVVIQYDPTTTLGVGFAVLHLVDPSTDERLPMMDSIYKVVSETYKGSGRKEYSLSEDGIVRGPFGIPDISAITAIMEDMTSVYYEWKDFPNETEYSVVRQLNEAKKKIKKMQSEVGLKTIETRISDRRNMIQEAQNEIAELEKKLNTIYEEAADAMNLLEEHGVKVDDPEKWEDNNKFPDCEVTIPYDPSALITLNTPGDQHIYKLCDEDINAAGRTWSKEEIQDIINESLASCAYNSIGTSSSSSSGS